MRIYRRGVTAGVIALGFLLLLLWDWTQLSCSGLLTFSGWVRDEASCAARSADSFHAAGLKPDELEERRYFSAMDGGIKLSPEQSSGRNMWLVWTGGNDRFWDQIIENTFGAFDLLKTLSSHPLAGYCSEPRDSGDYDSKSDSSNSDLNEAYWALNETECRDAHGEWVSISRDNRWSYFGLVNEPCFDKAAEPDEYGLWLDKRVPASPECPLDPFENERKYPGVKIGARGKTGPPVGSYYGKASGVMGLRLFPNPAFDEEAAKKWDPVKFYTEPTYYKDKHLIRPYRVGMSCAFCHVGPSPVHPPADPEHPKWENLSSTVGAQYLWFDRVFLWNPQDHKNFIYQLLHTGRPGTFDTSLVSSDNINNPRTMNAVYGLGPRLKAALRWGKETLVGGSLGNRQLNEYPESLVDGVPTHAFFQPPDTVWTPRVLKDGSDSVGVLGSLNRVYLNIGTFSEEWLLHFAPFVGATPFRPITPISIADAQKNSEYWKATEAQTPYMVQFLLRAGQPHRLKDIPGGDTFLEKAPGVLNTGKDVFADYCARCHSSKIPPAVGLDDPSCSGAGKDYLRCWNKYWSWTKTPGFKEEMRKLVRSEDFLADNYLSTDVRVPVTLLQTHICSPLASNAVAGDIWDNFSSQSYKDLPSVGSIEVFPRWKEDQEEFSNFAAQDPTAVKTHTYEMPAGGRGYTRPPSLISLWSTAPFLLNNALGKFNQKPSVESRIASFDSSIHQLLWPEDRERDRETGMGLIDRTTVQSYLSIPAGYLPDALVPLRNWLSRQLPWIFEPSGDVKIGPIPARTPVNLLANLDLSRAGVPFLLRASAALKRLPQVASDKQARKVFTPLVQDLLRLSRCPDFVVNKGHYFGTALFDEERPLNAEEKKALIEFLKTF